MPELANPFRIIHVRNPFIEQRKILNDMSIPEARFRIFHAPTFIHQF